MSQSQQVRLIRVFVSSPGDVQKERKVLDEVVASINRTDGQAGGFRLEPFRWEENVTPQVGPKPQDVVDGQTPPYDIYLGIMSTRFGTPTDEHGSGTEKEFRDALAKWKEAKSPWITFYFDARPQLSDDPDDVEQYLSLCKFKKDLQEQGIIATYSGVRGSADSFYEKVSEHLRQIARSLIGRTGADACGGSGSVAATIPADYLRWLQDDCADVDLLGLRVQHGQTVKLNNVYVPLTTPAHGDKDVATRVGPERGEERPVQTLLDLLDKESLYVAGSPGSGKSTFCRWAAWLACEGHMPPAQIPPPEEYQEHFPASINGRLPLLVRLRDFWTHVPRTPGRREMTKAELEDALADWVESKQPGGLSWNTVSARLDQGSLLLILDGLDEVPLSHGEGKKRWEPRSMLIAGLAAAIRPWVAGQNRVLLTSRPYGVSQHDVERLGLSSTLLGNLDEPMQQLLVHRWFGCLMERPEAAEARATEMLGHIATRGDIQALVANPMLLTAICIVYHQGQRLPHGRYDLYDRVIDNVLFNRFPEDREVVDPVRNRLAVVAYGMHTGEGLGEDRTTPQAEVTISEIDKMIQAYQDQTSWTELGYRGTVEAREELLSRTGLLLPHDDQRAGFYHFTFQDFLAARRLLDLRENELFNVFRRRGVAPEWRSTLSFVFGALLARYSAPHRGTDLLGQLVTSLQDDDVVLAVLVGECLQILLKRGVRLHGELDETFRQYCLRAIEREVPLRERHELALALGFLGDPRIPTDLRKHEAILPISPGTYRVGDDGLRREFVNEFGNAASNWTLDESVIELEKSVWLLQYPVTNRQYAPFIEDGGYEDRQWWSDEGWKWHQKQEIDRPEYWHDSKWNAPNKPVVGVSYWESEAFAKWAGGRLLSEREWEAAARGPNGYVYPWGNEWEDGICNSSESNIGETTPVGMFPRSHSQDLGLVDMAGNVWEWCSDEWGAL